MGPPVSDGIRGVIRKRLAERDGAIVLARISDVQPEALTSPDRRCERRAVEGRKPRREHCG